MYSDETREFVGASRDQTLNAGFAGLLRSWPISLVKGNRAEEKVCNIKLGSYSCKGRP